MSGPVVRQGAAARAARVRLFLTDVDGVMTDGTVLLLPDGQEAKAFHIRDGLAIVLAVLIDQVSTRVTASRLALAARQDRGQTHVAIQPSLGERT